MEALPLHPKLVHLPIALSVLMPLLTSGILLAWWRGFLPKRSWLLVVAAQVLLVGSAFLAMRTGEADAERAEASGVPEAAIEAHEEAAETFLQVGGVLLVVVVLPLFIRNQKVSYSLAGAGVLGSLGLLALCFEVGEHGGELVYRYGAGKVSAAAAPSGGAPAAHRDEDDD
jgi:uncharacterized membrane protein